MCSVLFVDLVGFTSLSETRDPEEVRELLDRYFEVARTVVGRYGGIIEKFIGDAVMAVWGTPVASEGDAERAVRAGLELVDAVGELGRDSGVDNLTARAGVVTGSVAVTLGAQGQGMVAGDSVNSASRVQGIAEPGTVLVDQGTWRVAQAAVSFIQAGSHALKGKAEVVPLWRAERVLSGVGGSQRVDGLEAPFVGRDPDLRLVKELFHNCVDRGVTRLVSVTGAAGVGKTRIGWEFFKYVDGLADTVLWHRGRCLSYGDGVAFWALAEMVRQRLDIAEEESIEAASDKLTAGLARWLPDEGERAFVEPRLAQLLGTDMLARPTLGRDELFAGWRLFLERLAGHAPVVLVIDDLQHADTGLLDFCEHLLDWAREVPIFVLTLARPELQTRRPGWGSRRNSTALALEPLTDASMELLLEGLVPGMPKPAKDAIAVRAEGIPLYAVETVRMLIDRDVVQPIDGVYRLLGDVGDLAVPATLQSLLAARLDQLDPEVRRLVADAAVLGGSFPREALVAVSGRSAAEVDKVLAELVHREVLGVRADPLSPQRGQYAFVQTMLRQVAYDMLSRRERKSRHLAVAAHLQEAFAGGGEEIADVIAAHLLDAMTSVPDDPDVPALRAAAVEMLDRGGARAERTGAALSAVRSYIAAAQLLENSDQVDDQLAAAALYERAGKVAETRDQDAAIQHFRTSAEIYTRYDNKRGAARANTGVGRALGWLGQHDEARRLLRDALAVFEQEPDADTAETLGDLAAMETFAGTDDGDRLSAAALAMAQALDLSGPIVDSLLTVRGISHYFGNRPVEAVAYAREALRRAEQRQDSGAMGRVLLNLAEMLVATDAPAAVEAARAACAHCRRFGASVRLGFAANNLMLALLTTGEWDEAEQVYRTCVDDDGLGDDPVLAYAAVMLYSLRGDEPEVARVLPVIDRWAGNKDPQTMAASAIVKAAAATCHGEHADALHYARNGLQHADAIGLRNDAIRWGWPMAADAALSLGDQTQAQEVLDWFDAYPSGHVPPVLRAERLRVRARLAAISGDPSAPAAFDTATNALRELGAPYQLAVGLVDQAAYLESIQDFHSAAPLADEALAIARRLEAKPLVQRATRLTNDLVASQSPTG
ncbi:MAG: adenylate/guanylate cyclase domain-containing protein [Candidatus Nanopelagicales bacterium]